MKKVLLSIFLGTGFGFAVLSLQYNIWQHSQKYQTGLIIFSSFAASCIVYFLLRILVSKIKDRYSKKQILILAIGSLLVSLTVYWAIHYSIFLPPGKTGEHTLEILITNQDQELPTKNHFAIIEIQIDNRKIDLKRLEQIEGKWVLDDETLSTNQAGKLKFVYEGNQYTPIEILQSRSFFDSNLLIGIDGIFRSYNVASGNNINLGQTLMKIQVPPINNINQYLFFGSSIFFIIGVFFVTFSSGIIALSTKKGSIFLILSGLLLQGFAMGGGVINLIISYPLIPRGTSETLIMWSMIGFLLFITGTIRVSCTSPVGLQAAHIKQYFLTSIRWMSEKSAVIDILIILIPIGIFTLISNQGWLFDASYAPDAWVYKAHFYYPGYGEHVSYLDQNYKISRLSFIIPGYLIYKLFGPTAGYYIYALGILIASLVIFYFLTRMLFNRQISLVSTLTLACFTYLHGNIGWTYHNGAFSLYYIGTIFFLSAAAKLQFERSYLLTFLGGCSFAATLVINPSAVVFAPCLISFVFLLGKEPFRKSIWQSLLCFMGGIFLVTISLGAIHFLSGGPSFEFILSHMNKFASKPISSVIHFKFTTYLTVIFIVSIGVLLFSLFSGPRAENKHRKNIILSQLFNISSLLIFLLLGYLMGQNIFGLSFVSYVLIIPAMIGLSGVFAIIFEKDERLGGLWFGVLACMGFTVPLLFAQTINVNNFFEKYPHFENFMLIFGIIGILFALILKKIKASMILMISVLSVLNLYSGIDLSVYSLFGPDCSISKDTHKAYLDTTRFLKIYPDLPEKAKYWYDLEENVMVQPELGLCPSIPLTNVFFPISRGILAQAIDNSPLDENRVDIEDWSDQMIERVGRTGYLVGFSSPENWESNFQRIESRMEKSGYDLIEKNYSLISEGKISFRVTIMELD